MAFLTAVIWVAIFGFKASAQFGTFGMNKPVHYFVMTSQSTNGNIVPNPDAFCHTDLTNYAWKGKPSYSIPASRVKAFLCDTTTCPQLLPHETYIFAKSGDLAAGGARFTTNASGFGPDDLNSWMGFAYFNATKSWWSGRAVTGGTAYVFANNPTGTACSSWTSSSFLSNGASGTTNATNANRWSAANTTCDQALQLICLVDL